MLRPSHQMKLSSLLIALLVALAGCGGDKDKKSATQVAAKVNSSEISVHQVNAVLSKLQGVPPEAAAAVRKEVLGKLIDQQLAFDQAVEKKLDRNPEVMTAIESAKREIISRAYLDQVVGALPKFTDDDVKNYYTSNPALFSQRRVYNLQELTVEGKSEILPELRQLVSSGKSMDEIVNWLKAKDVKYKAAAAPKPAEQISLDVLPKLLDLKDGQTRLLEGQQNYLILHLLASQSAPVDEVAAKPRILQFLNNQRAKKTVEEEIQRLKAAAKIEYLGDFAASAETPAVKPPVPEAKPEAKPAEKAADGKIGNSNMEKGVAGLK